MQIAFFEKKKNLRGRGWWRKEKNNWWCRQQPTTDWRTDYRATCRWNEEAEICNLPPQSSILIFSLSRVGKKSRGSSNSAESTVISSSRGLMVWTRFIFLMCETLVIRNSILWRCWKPKQWKKYNLGFQDHQIRSYGISRKKLHFPQNCAGEAQLLGAVCDLQQWDVWDLVTILLLCWGFVNLYAMISQVRETGATDPTCLWTPCPSSGGPLPLQGLAN